MLSAKKSFSNPAFQNLDSHPNKKNTEKIHFKQKKILEYINRANIRCERWHLQLQFEMLKESWKRLIQESKSKKLSTFSSALANGQITLITPVLLRSLKVSNIEPSQYLDGWPPGNTGCCWLRKFLQSFPFLFYCSTWHHDVNNLVKRLIWKGFPMQVHSWLLLRKSHECTYYRRDLELWLLPQRKLDK